MRDRFFEPRQGRHRVVQGLRRGLHAPKKLSKLGAHASAECGCATPLCGKPVAFRAMPNPWSSSAQAGRLSLPACAEEVLQDARPAERRSLSAQQAAKPHVIVNRIERNLEKPDMLPSAPRAEFFNELLTQDTRNERAIGWERKRARRPQVAEVTKKVRGRAGGWRVNGQGGEV
jgi:hypothetical protein